MEKRKGKNRGLAQGSLLSGLTTAPDTFLFKEPETAMLRQEVAMDRAKTELKRLLCELAGRVQSLLTEGKFAPSQRVLTRLRFSGFRYEESGPDYDSGWLEQTLEPDWPNAAWDDIMNSVLATEEYEAASAAVLKLPQGEKNQDYLRTFVTRLVRGPLATQSTSAELLSDFTRFLYGEARKHTLTAQLDGLLVFSEEVVVSHAGDGFVLRQATQEDAEGFVDRFHPMQDQLRPAPAILQIVSFAHENVPIKMLNLLLKSVAVLRLFGLGSIAYRSYTDDLSLFSAPSRSTTYSSHTALSAPYKYKISIQDGDRLIAFWTKMCDAIPQSLYSVTEKEAHYLRIAYERYSESILSNRPWESRIMMASMALESLFLPENNQAELNYRLATFAAKVLGILGMDPIEVKKRLKTAYRFRSRYVHGGQLTSKEKGKPWENETIEEFTRTVLDYVRICLITFVILSSSMSKNELTDLIDNSLISDRAYEELQEVLIQAKETIELGIFAPGVLESTYGYGGQA